MSTELIPALRQKRGVGVDAAIYQQDAWLEYLHRYLHEYRFISRRTERPLPAHYLPTYGTPFARHTYLICIISVEIPKRQSQI